MSSWLRRALAALCMVGGIASVGCVGEDDRCVELADEERCLDEQGCAWGTDAEGPHCFYVGDVTIQ